MAAFLKAFLPMLIMVIIIIIVYNALKIYVLENIKVNKWVILVIGLIVLFVPQIIWHDISKSVWYYVQTAVFLVLFLWFMDLVGLNKNRNTKNDKGNVIRSKANPNRINKVKDMEVIEKGKKKKKKK